MTAKEHLKQARTLDMEINTKLEEIHQLQLKASCAQSVAVSERVQSSRDNSSNTIIDKIVDMQNEINAEINKLVDLKAEIREKINQLSDERYIMVLTEYYLNCKTWEQVAEDNNFSRRHIFKLHGQALQAFRKKFDMD